MAAQNTPRRSKCKSTSNNCRININVNWYYNIDERLHVRENHLELS